MPHARTRENVYTLSFNGEKNTDFFFSVSIINPFVYNTVRLTLLLSGDWEIVFLLALVLFLTLVAPGATSFHLLNRYFIMYDTE